MTEQKMWEIHTGESGRDVNYRTIVSVKSVFAGSSVSNLYWKL